MSAACATPAASMTARMSSIRCSNVGEPPTRSDSPVPRLSNKMSRENDATCSTKPRKYGTSQAAYRCEMNPGA